MKRIISLFTVCTLLLSLAVPVFAAPKVPEDGLYSVGVTSSSKMFRVTGCLLEATQGQMVAVVTLSSNSYGYLFQGTAEQADAASRDMWIAPVDPADKTYSFRVPIPALDEPVDVAAWSKKYEKWYDRQLTFLSGSLRAEEQAPEKDAAPPPDDGRYQIEAYTDSPLLKVEDCVLTVENGQMQAQITIADSKYALLFPGLAKDALQADASTHIRLLADRDGKASAILPVSALDEELPLSTWSSKKNLWYDRTLRLDSASLKPLGAQEGPSFSFAGGSGRTTISLKSLDEPGGLATIVFSSPHYTQVKLNDEIYLNESQSGDATFTLPLVINGPTQISAQTVAMSKPRWVDYTLYLYTDGTDAAQFVKSSVKRQEPQPASLDMRRPEIPGLSYLGDVQLEYARNVIIRKYEDGWHLIQTANGRDYLLVPEGARIPESARDGRFILLQQPLDSIYLVATSAMCLLDAIGALPSLRFSGTKAEGWHIQAAKEAMEAGTLVYAGKYSAPDYELLLSGGCDLTIQSTMVLQAPEVQEKFRELGIPMFIDMSSLEGHPLGRTEWVKVYGVLEGEEEAADKVFQSQRKTIERLAGKAEKGPSAAYFYVNSNGAVVSKAAGDYIPALIGLAGGRYLGPDSRTADTASVTMDMEAFYALAKEADVLIYNAAIDSPPQSMADLLIKNDLFADFKAVKEGRVYAASAALYQSSHRFGDVAEELHNLFANEPAGFSDGFFQRIP